MSLVKLADCQLEMVHEDDESETVRVAEELMGYAMSQETSNCQTPS